MGEYSTKSFFKKRLKEYATDDDYSFFEVSPAPDCCLKCEEKANKKIAISTATNDDYPPFHRECRCSILPLEKNEEAGALNKLRAQYASGELPYKRCPLCKEWISGNAIHCNRCNKSIP